MVSELSETDNFIEDQHTEYKISLIKIKPQRNKVPHLATNFAKPLWTLDLMINYYSYILEMECCLQRQSINQSD